MNEPQEGKVALAVEPLVEEVTVPLSQERAFALFTERVATWWPLVTYSVAREDAVACHFEPHVGGRLVETTRDGTEHVWGTVEAWQPPARIALTWRPGRTPSTAQQLEVTFVERGAETVVRLVHTGWERLADGGVAERLAYDSGWDLVLGCFVDQAGVTEVDRWSAARPSPARE